MLKHLFPNTLKNALILYTLLIALVLICVLFVDRPLAELMHAQQLSSTWLKALSKTPLLLEFLAGLTIFACISERFRSRFQALALELTFTLILAFSLRWLGKILFGRTWPESWFKLGDRLNPSWIADKVEAFHPFAQGQAYDSFPSGHALLTFALAFTFWRHSPKLMPLWLGCMAAVIAGQLSLNYHYLGDLLAGASFALLASQLSLSLHHKLRLFIRQHNESDGKP
ncbi:phosphatase PAP2 family protein [Shewanella marisflavi]|uniref:PA-phosphatase n=1 Tax=Shewanella marisflavi TaxID=260364 RepID=A0AAC9TXP2_9GAMM|nr:phosphatase PAP2 family protein [Shewanella marisflavi]ASJ95981.1 PA-phosphatase [Shewanella marisflavi]